MSGVIFDRLAARVKGKVYKMLLRPAIIYGLKMVALTKTQEVQLELLRFFYCK